MARRISPAQFQAMARQAQQRQRQAVDNYNREVRRYNSNLQGAVNNYNRAARAHNARVRANRDRLRSSLAQLRQRSATTSFTSYRLSVQTMYESYSRLEHVAEEHGLDADYPELLDLSEREMANSLAVANSLEDPAAPVEEPPDDGGLGDSLRAVSPDLDARWRGAVFALNPRNPDAARHFCTSAREIVVQLVDQYAPDDEVARHDPRCERTTVGRPTRRAKLGFMVARRGAGAAALAEFADGNVANILELFRTFNDGTHGSAATFSMTQLVQIRRRVEDGIRFLTALTGG